MDKAIFGGGCFWCIQALLRNLKGVQKVMPGYCGGREANPTYIDVKTGTTGHIEVVQITYEPTQITFQQLLEVFMNIHDPTQSDGQGEDIGSQYLSSIFCQNDSQLQITKKVIEKLGQELKNQGKKIYTLIFNDLPFYEAQEYHQNYYETRGKENPYCDIIPDKIAKMKHFFKQICHE